MWLDLGIGVVTSALCRGYLGAIIIQNGVISVLCRGLSRDCSNWYIAQAVQSWVGIPLFTSLSVSWTQLLKIQVRLARQDMGTNSNPKPIPPKPEILNSYPLNPKTQNLESLNSKSP